MGLREEVDSGIVACAAAEAAAHARDPFVNPVIARLAESLLRGRWGWCMEAFTLTDSSKYHLSSPTGPTQGNLTYEGIVYLVVLHGLAR